MEWHRSGTPEPFLLFLRWEDAIDEPVGSLQKTHFRFNLRNPITGYSRMELLNCAYNKWFFSSHVADGIPPEVGNPSPLYIGLRVTTNDGPLGYSIRSSAESTETPTVTPTFLVPQMGTFSNDNTSGYINTAWSPCVDIDGRTIQYLDITLVDEALEELTEVDPALGHPYYWFATFRFY